MNQKIKVILLEPGKLARTAEIDSSLEAMQRIVDGYIEPYCPFDDSVCIICNEEGKINGMEPNRSVKDEKGELLDFIFGPAFLCGCKGEDFSSLSEKQIARYSQIFRYPEHLIKYENIMLGRPFNPESYSNR